MQQATTPLRVHKQSHHHNQSSPASAPTAPPQHQQQQQQQPITKETVTKHKIPAIFLPLVADIVPLPDMLNKHPAVKRFSSKATGGAGRGLRIQCHDLDTYNAVPSVLHQEKLQLHTHQPRQLKGYRVVLKHLHQ
ncbi:hypothetical protein AWZ03_014742 [Drosophila navojoa]|uniref:Uncharacterized protein n=1 Tax=Drosophila navojoa TaxID=7232 RepID=A0A484APX2_DRONA|nr:hypothetical protein AWZ03_014742 [Drosophila navojoa]